MLAATAAAQSARADDECGVGAAVTCDASGNPYPHGIVYIVTGDQTVNIASGVAVDASLAPFAEHSAALWVENDSAGAVVVNADPSASITAENATGVSLYTNSGDITGTFGAVEAKGDGEGVVAYTRSGDVTLNVGQVATDHLSTYANGIGIDAGTNAGSVTVTAGKIVTSGGSGSIGIYAGSSVTTTITADSISTTGIRSPGIDASSLKTTVINAGSVSTSGDSAPAVWGLAGGIFGTPDESLSIHVTGPIHTTGSQSPGVWAQSGAYVIPDAPYYPSANGARVDVVIDGDVSSTGTYAPAVDVESYWGPASLTINAGKITTAFGDAAYLSGDTVTATFGGKAVVDGFGFADLHGATVTNYGTINGLYGGGVTAALIGPGPAVVHNFGTINSIGMAYLASDTIDNAGTITGSVYTSNGPDTLANTGTLAADVNMGDGDNTLNNSGTFTGSLATGAGADNFINSATFAGAVALGGGADTVTNSGTFTGLLDAGAGNDVANNSGTFRGAVSMGDGDDVFNNTGTFVAETAPGVAGADSDFGAGADTFNNSGLVSVRPNDTSAGTVTFKGLETFNNKGTISLVNGHPGDRLVLPGTYNGSGAAVLAVDVATRPTLSSDTLVVGGAATGHTAIEINPIGGHGVAMGGTTIVQAGAGSAADAFTVAPGSASAGFIDYQLVFDPADDSYALVGAPGAAVFETVKVEELVSDFARQGADAWSSHMAQARDAHWGGGGWRGIHGWGQFYGGARNRAAAGSTDSFDVSQTFDLGYDANVYGFQGGLDVAAGPWIFGLTAGYGGADQRFHATHDHTQMQGYGVGAYAGIQYGGAFIQVLGRYNDDRIQMGVVSIPTIDVAARTWGGTVEFGYRFAGRGFFIEPVGSIDYQRTRLDDIAALGSSFAFDRFVSSVGKAGVRFGGALGDWNGARVVPYAQVSAVHEFKGTDGFVFSSGGYDFGYADGRQGTYGHASAGIDLIARRGVDGYLQADLDFANGAGGGGGRIGVRFAF